MKMIRLICLVAGILSMAMLNAQMPVMQVNGQKDSKEVYLQQLDIQVDVSGNVASTRFLMTFKNRTNKILEGELLFPLPEGITVSSYALDINGKLREAVPVEKAKATQVFEEIEQRRVDPGLLERVEGNNFRTRIYPIPTNGTRTIAIGYEEELTVEKAMLSYRLPMDYKEAIEKFTVKATVWQTNEKPIPAAENSGDLTFDKAGTNYVAEFTRANYLPGKLLAFSLPVRTDIPQTLLQSASGSYYFVASCFPEIATRKKEWNNNIDIIWDASLSGLQRDLQKETALLEKLFDEKKNLTVTLYLLNNQFVSAGTFKSWTDLKKVLDNVIYDGGTDYSKINPGRSGNREILFFSDGLSTLSDVDFLLVNTKLKKAGIPIHTITSSSKADYSALKWISSQTNGKFINLNALTESQLTNELFNETLHYLGVEASSSIREVYPSTSTPARENFSVAGILDAQQGNITLLFGYGGNVVTRVPIKLDAGNATQAGNAHRLWAQKKIAELDMQYEKNKDELTELGQEFGIVTRNTSLIVLETLDDYIRYNITPPAELQAEYLNWRKDRDSRLQAEQKSLLNNAIAAAEELKTWWNTEFKPKKRKYPKPDDEVVIVSEYEQGESLDALERVVPPPPAPEMQAEQVPYFVGDVVAERLESASNDQVELSLGWGQTSQINAIELSKAKEKKSQIQPTIKLTPLKQDNEYFKTLIGEAEADYAAYLKIRPEYINTPTFYFDMANWFYSLNDKEKALRILTCIADLEIENASLFRLLGYRLKEYKEYELEVYICQKVIQWRPMEPQSYRDYALALADMGKKQEALDALYSVLTQSYAQNISTRSSGIEEVVVTELNHLISTNKKLNTGEINSKLIQDIPVDIRVVINWNMNSTDIDLHVKDPNGETCYYRNKKTQIGGRISNDITQGYGPEHFMLKKAISGKYEIFVKYFGDSQVKAEGPSTIMVDVYTKYAGKEEQRQATCLQSSKDTKSEENGLIKVAEFEF